jgi:uncharacterized membrane protein
MKISKKLLIITTLFILLPILFGVLNWNKLPDSIATHWNLEGVPDGYSSKPFTVFGLPFIMAIIQIICFFAHKLDPKRANYSDKLFIFVLWLCPALSIILSYVTYAHALGYEVNVPKIITMLMGFVFIIVGNYMPKVKQNYTLGIKLPWTLNDETNWYKTHKLAGWLWMLSGILTMICSFLNFYIIILIVMIVSVLIPTIYSYLIYKQNKNTSDE